MKKHLLALTLLVSIAAMGHAQTHQATLAGLKNRLIEKGITPPHHALLNSMGEKETNPVFPTLSAAANVQIMDSIYHWEWNTATDAWKAQPYSRDNAFVYDANNKLLSKIIQLWDGSAWANYQRYTYDPNNNMLSDLIEGWNGNAWNDGFRYTYIYDSNNNMLSYLLEFWNGSAWGNSLRHAYTYDSNNNMLSDLQEAWSNNSNAWYNQERHAYTYDSNNNMLSDLQEVWSNWTNAWENQIRSTHTYDSNNILLSSQLESWSNNTWVNAARFTYTYDSNNNQLRSLGENWDGTSWNTHLEDKFTYDGDNFLESQAYKTWSSGSISYADSTHYYYHTAVGISEQDAGPAIQAYPNPSNGPVRIDLGKTIDHATLNIYNPLGALVHTQKLNGVQYVNHQLQGTKGVYLLQVVTSKGGVSNFKVIKN